MPAGDETATAATGGGLTEPATAMAGIPSDLDPQDFARRIELLEGAPVFAEMPDRILRRLARRMEPVAVSAGSILLELGETNTLIFFIASGVCETAVPGAETPWVQKLPPGEVFGLAAAMGEALQPTTVTAVDPGLVYTADARVVRSVLAEFPAAVERLERLASQTLEKDRQMQLRATSTVMQRADAVVVPVYSATGGSGRTTVALNLCAALAAEAPGRVLLIDLALPYPQACLMANLIPSGSLATATRFVGLPIEQALLGAALYHPSGMMVLPAATYAEEAELVTGALVERSLDALKDKFSYIVVDMAMPLDDLAVAVLDRAQQVVLVMTPELPAIRGAAEALKVLDEAFGIPQQLVTVVLNQRSPKPATSVAAIAAALDRDPDLEVKNDDGRPAAAGLRGALSFQDRRSTLQPAMVELAARVQSLGVAPDLRPKAAPSS